MTATPPPVVVRPSGRCTALTSGPPGASAAPAPARTGLVSRLAADDGQSTVEYALVLLAVAAMVAVIATAGPQLVGDLMRRITESVSHGGA